MKHRLIIWTFLCCVYFACYFTGWIITLAFGAETPALPAGRQTPKTIALCFDDGPRPWVLKELLPVLEKYKTPGNFFVIGCFVPQNKELVRKMHEAGYEIENHSWGHENFKKLYKEKGASAIKSNLNRTYKVICDATGTCKIPGKTPLFFRPPFWQITNEIEKIIADEGYIVMKIGKPDINTMDYANFEGKRLPEVLIERVKSIIAKRERQKIFTHVLVFHELPISTKALKTLIPYFQNQGYKLIRLDKMFPK